MSVRNQVQLIGNLGTAPEMRKFEDGKVLAKVSIAVTNQYQNAVGQEVKNTQWFTISAWGKIAERMELQCEKGSKLVVFGKLESGSYKTKEGTKKYFTEVVVNDFLVLYGQRVLEESPVSEGTPKSDH